jgi:signal peptidase II
VCVEFKDESMITKMSMRIVLLVAIGATIGCDRVTKHLAAATLSGAPVRSFFADTVRLQYAENPGGFLSLGASLPSKARASLFTIGTGLALLILCGVAIRSTWSGWPILGLSLFAAGGASNWIDRITRGSVIDFLSIGFGSLRTGIFNVADVAIMIGAGILVFAGIWDRQKDIRIERADAD